MASPWSELPEDLLALVFARIFFPSDRARFQAVCRSWRSAERPPPKQMPWIMFPFGAFVDLSDRVMRRLVSFPEPASCIGDYYDHRHFSFHKTTKCIGSTDGWIAIDCVEAENKHKYLLHNVFSSMTLSLPELDAAVGHASELFKIRKVLLRSTPDDVIAILTNHRSCPIILTRPGKGVWLPKWHARPLTLIVDVAFLGDRLYGITVDKDLVFLDIAFDDNGVPMVTDGKCVIGEDYYVWSNEEEFDDDDDDIDNDDDADDHNGDDVATDAADGHPDNDEENDDDDDDDDDGDNYEEADEEDEDGDSNNYEEEDEDEDDIDDHDDTDDDEYDLTKMTQKDITGEAIQYTDDDEPPYELYLLESCGKLLMVRRQVLSPDGPLDSFTHKVEVLEADISAAMWVPVKDEIGGQALFVSRPFCKSVSAACSKEIQADAIYFIDTDDVFDMRLQTVSAQRDDVEYRWTLWNIGFGNLTWVFPPELVPK
ncbi:unnamed protein product [Alopecurus aequalis]